MVRFELKKMLGKTGGKIALLLLAAIVVICSWCAVNVDYYDEQGNYQTGFAAVRKLRSMQKEWSGVLDEEMLREVIAENQRITSHPDYISPGLLLSEYPKKQCSLFYGTRHPGNSTVAECQFCRKFQGL